MRSALVIGACVLASSAWATPDAPSPERRYWDAQLLQSSSGDHRQAVQIYRDLATQLDAPQHAELRARAMLAAGRALRALGDLDEARKAFEACRRLSTAGIADIDTSACAAGARQVALEQGAIREVPTRWTFERSEEGFVLFSERGSMALETREGQGALVWSQEIAGPQVADLIVAVDQPERAPSGVRIELHAEDDNALMELIVEDERGFAYALSGKLYRIDATPRLWEVPIQELEPLDPSWPALDSARISAIRLRDSTGSQLPELRARHRIVLRSFEIY
ncbi:MAG: hypothetical protein EA397_03825 [Deltaproteobacteria bacterium]|nr:MAG: hypothetical protein EA397_03825 [Deltaproteobacteria bacterium]